MSDTPKMDKDRRTWLIATSAVGGCGAAAVAYPFLDSFSAFGARQGRWCSS